MTPRFRERMEQSGGRRFVLTLIAGAVASLLVWFDKVTSEAWAAVVIATVAAYITGNTYQKKTAVTKEEADA